MPLERILKNATEDAEGDQVPDINLVNPGRNHYKIFQYALPAYPLQNPNPCTPTALTPSSELLPTAPVYPPEPLTHWTTEPQLTRPVPRPPYPTRPRPTDAVPRLPDERETHIPDERFARSRVLSSASGITSI